MLISWGCFYTLFYNSYAIKLQMNEAQFSRKICAFLKTRNAFVFNTTGSRYQRPGMPDLLVCHNLLPNKAVWFELKVGKNKLSEVQKLTIGELRRRGQIVYILRSLETQALETQALETQALETQALETQALETQRVDSGVLLAGGADGCKVYRSFEEFWSELC